MIGNLKSKTGSMYGYLRLKLYIMCASQIRLILGASGIGYKGWLKTEIEYLDLLKEKHWERVFQENSIYAILAEHVWEHLTYQEGLMAARNCYKYLKPGGYIRAAVPDGHHPDSKYIDHIKVKSKNSESHGHKTLFNHNMFEEVFKCAGFDTCLLEYFDSDKKFHFSDWDPALGMIRRSKRFDKRNKLGKLEYTSIIIDAKKKE